MSTVIDFHSHILPGIDDGSASVEQSLSMLKKEADQGVKCVVATPHFYAQHNDPEQFLKKREEAKRLLLQQMQHCPGLPEIKIGAEVYYFSGISHSEILQQLAIEGTQYVLIELPMSQWSERIYRDLEGIWLKQGLTPIIAHVDRYIAPFATHGIPKKLQQLPVLVQANAEFFLNSSTRWMALRMLRKDQIHLLGSDCHDLSRRPPQLGDAVKVIRQKLGEDMIRHINGYEADVFQEKEF